MLKLRSYCRFVWVCVRVSMNMFVCLSVAGGREAEREREAEVSGYFNIC